MPKEGRGASMYLSTDHSPMTQGPILTMFAKIFGCPLGSFFVAVETMMHSGLSWSTSILPFLEEARPLIEPVFVLG